MSKLTSKAQILKFIGWLMLGMTALFAYNNCGEKAYQLPVADQPVQKLQAEMARTYASEISADMCAREDLYRCVHRIFSEDVDSFEVDLEFPCINSNNFELCVNGRQYGFNSKAAKEKCGQDCDQSYEYEEFSCHLNLPVSNGKYPISGFADNFEEALDQASASCLKFVQGLRE